MRFIWLIALSGWLAARTLAEDVHIAYGDVIDSRMMTGDSLGGGCEVELRAVGDAVADAKSIRGVRVQTATDDTGRDLTNPKPGSATPFAMRTSGGDFLAKRVRLRNPARSATVIKLLEGELDLFHPTTENGGKIILKGFQSHPGEFIESADLEKANVKLIYVTKDTEKSAIDRLDQETTRHGDVAKSGTMPPWRRMPWGPTYPMDNVKNPVQFMFTDPDGKLADFAFLESSGAVISNRGSGRGPTFFHAGFDTALPHDAQLVIYLTTPASIKTIPFKLENIPLP